MIIFILVIGLALRLISLNQSLWLDEAISALAARDFSYSGITFDFLKIDNHPPIFYLLLKFWGESFGFVDWILRLLSVSIGTLLILFVYKIVNALTSNKTISLLSAFFTATSPILVYFSQEVRMYILITLLVTIQIFIFQSLLKKKQVSKWILLSILNCLLFFSDYITIFIFPVFIVFALVNKRPKLLLKTLLSFIPLGILLILWFPVFSTQLNNNQEIINNFPLWQNVIGGSTFKNLAVLWMKFVGGRISFEPKYLYYLFISLASVPVLIGLLAGVKTIKQNFLIWIWLITPLTLGFLTSFYIPVFNFFRFIYVVPALIILTVIGFFQIKSSIMRNTLILWLILANAVGILIYYIDPSQQRENWKQAVEFIENEAKDDDLVVFEFKEEPAPYRWYSKGKVKSIGATDSYFADRTKTHQKLEKVLIEKNGIYYFEYLRDLSDPNRYVEEKLIQEGFKKGEIFNDFYNIGQITYWFRE